jgi:serine/threonine-protein kinase
MEEEGDLVCIVMGLVEGPSFSRKLRAGMPLQEALKHAIEIGEGLRCAHDHGIIHRDIKASNILISRENVAKITDFGLALQENRSRLTERGTLMGTINVMAPEQVMAEDADRRTDIWAFGVLLYEVLTGRQPFERGSYEATMRAILHERPTEVTRLQPGLPEDLCWILDKTLSKSRSERYQHVDDLVADLRSVAGRLAPEQHALMVGKSQLTELPTQTVHPPDSKTVRSGLGWPLAAAALVIFAAVVYFLVRMLR